MFDIFIKNFMKDGSVCTDEELKIQSVPVSDPKEIYLLNPIVKNDMGNAEGFEFSVEPGTKYYNAFLQMKTLLLRMIKQCMM